jgi:succinylglutamate desuccinylase
MQAELGQAWNANEQHHVANGGPFPAGPDGRVPRLIGTAGDGDGPLLVIVGSIHGNEPSGVRALTRVFGRLAAEPQPIRGRLVALVGNTAALPRGVRFVAHDLNRAWTDRILGAVRPGPRPGDAHEDAELRELDHALRDVRALHDGSAFLLDLHTTSSGGAPFGIPGSDASETAFGRRLPVTIVRGLVGRIAGPLIEHAADHGWHAVVVEAGQHDAATSVDRHEAAIWLALEAAGCLPHGTVPDGRAHIATLRHAAHGTPAVLEIFHRHSIRPDDDFVMEPGWRHFQSVRAGDLLAHDHRGTVVAPADGILLMPLYQGNGTDGFFLGRAATG